MAKIGLKRPVYAELTETDSTTSYSNGAVLAKAISASISIEINDTQLYADDAVAESDRSFSSGTISFTIDDLSDAAKIALLGNTEGSVVDVSSGAREIKAGGFDSPAYVGFGFYSKKVVNKATYWRAIWLKKVQFAEPADELTTKGETTEFGTTTLEGTIMVAADGYWKEEGTFDTETEAIAYLNAKAGISDEASNNITALSITNGTLTPTFAATTRIYSCACSGDIDLTATFAAGTARVYVDGVYFETLATTVKGGTIEMDPGDNKIIQIVVQESGKQPVTYTIVAQRAA